MKIHHLKTWPEYFVAILDGTKTFEIREIQSSRACLSCEGRGFIFKGANWDADAKNCKLCGGEGRLYDEVRDFNVGDSLALEEWDNERKEYTGRSIAKRVSYVLKGGLFGLREGWVVMGLQNG